MEYKDYEGEGGNYLRGHRISLLQEDHWTMIKEGVNEYLKTRM